MLKHIMKDTVEILTTLIELDKLDRSPERKSMEEKVEAFRKRLPQPILAYYDRCRACGRKPVSVMNDNGVCRGCNVRALRGQLAALQRGDEIQVCENCGCYLLWEAASLSSTPQQP